MTTYSATIVDENGANPALGDQMDIVRTVTGLTTAQTIDKAWLTVKSSTSQADAEAALQLSITTASTASGQITDDGTGDTEGAITFTVAGSDFDDVSAGISYWYDIQLLLSDGQITTLEIGRVTWERDVTRATS